jgi:hypothetical protein
LGVDAVEHREMRVLQDLPLHGAEDLQVLRLRGRRRAQPGEQQRRDRQPCEHSFLQSAARLCMAGGLPAEWAKMLPAGKATGAERSKWGGEQWR